MTEVFLNQENKGKILDVFNEKSVNKSDKFNEMTSLFTSKSFKKMKSLVKNTYLRMSQL